MLNIDTIAKEYNKLEVNPRDDKTLKAYGAFIKEIKAQFHKMPINVEFTQKDPYKTSKAMFKDIRENNRLKVFTGGNSHPLMTKRENAIFRAIHDYYGHYLGLNSFSLKGEIRAWACHSRMFSKLARLALNTETLGQVSYYFTFKKYAVQKASLFDFNVGA